MKIDKSFTVDAPRKTVWEFITDAPRVASCIPGCEHVEDLGDDRYRATVNVRTGPIKATFRLDVETTAMRAPEYAAYSTKGEEGGRASRIHATSELTVEAVDDAQSLVRYSSEITISGRLGKFGAGVMQKIADKEGEKFASALRERLTSS